MKRLIALFLLTPLPALAQAVVTDAPAQVRVYDKNHHAIGDRPGSELVHQQVVAPTDDFGMLTVQTATGPVLVRDTSVHTSGTLPPPKEVACVNLAPAAHSAQVNSVNGLASRCQNAH